MLQIIKGSSLNKSLQLVLKHQDNRESRTYLNLNTSRPSLLLTPPHTTQLLFKLHHQPPQPPPRPLPCPTQHTSFPLVLIPISNLQNLTTIPRYTKSDSRSGPRGGDSNADFEARFVWLGWLLQKEEVSEKNQRGKRGKEDVLLLLLVLCWRWCRWYPNQTRRRSQSRW